MCAGLPNPAADGGWVNAPVARTVTASITSLACAAALAVVLASPAAAATARHHGGSGSGGATAPTPTPTPTTPAPVTTEPAEPDPDSGTSGDDPAWGGAGAGWNYGSTGGTTIPTISAPTAGWTPSATRAISVRGLEIDRAAISPNGDAEGDEVTVSFRLRRSSGAVAVKVVDAGGAAVRSLGTLSRSSDWGEFTWDGTNDAGAIVPDGAYRIVLSSIDGTQTVSGDTLDLGVAVDTAVPTLTAARPTITQVRALAKRAAKLRDEQARWARAAWGHRSHSGGRTVTTKHRESGSEGPATSTDMSADEQEWVKAWQAQQLRLPVTFTTGEAGEVTITALVGGRSTTLETYRSAGRQTANVVLPRYAAGTAKITIAASDDAGNLRRHTIALKLPALPAAKTATRAWRSTESSNGSSESSGGSTSTPVTNVPANTKGPFPDWLDPIMLRATYGAGVPQSWASSQALANLVRGESSFNPKAQNPTSTAYGLFQFLDQTWKGVGCTKTADAYQQSVCGLRYVQRRYGTPEKAWAFWQAQSPHWY
ncbi:MAG: tmp [Thermoleophilia bacterium]|nr:tmp [Thermoleophilia bacterium]